MGFKDVKLANQALPQTVYFLPVFFTWLSRQSTYPTLNVDPALIRGFDIFY
jgi:hypothetical protein